MQRGEAVGRGRETAHRERIVVVLATIFTGRHTRRSILASIVVVVEESRRKPEGSQTRRAEEQRTHANGDRTTPASTTNVSAPTRDRCHRAFTTADADRRAQLRRSRVNGENATREVKEPAHALLTLRSPRCPWHMRLLRIGDRGGLRTDRRRGHCLPPRLLPRSRRGSQTKWASYGRCLRCSSTLCPRVVRECVGMSCRTCLVPRPPAAGTYAGTVPRWAKGKGSLMLSTSERSRPGSRTC